MMRLINLEEGSENIANSTPGDSSTFLGIAFEDLKSKMTSIDGDSKVNLMIERNLLN